MEIESRRLLSDTSKSIALNHSLSVFFTNIPVDPSSTFSEKAKDYAKLSKDEIIKGLRALARAPHDARMELHKLVTDAKNTLGIQ